MPYIPQPQRKRLESHVDRLADEIVAVSKEDGHDAAYAGLLNYAMTALTLRILKRRFGKIRYWMIAATTGVFKNAADEFYRRLAAPYEDGKIAVDGDVKEYEEAVRDLRG